MKKLVLVATLICSALIVNAQDLPDNPEPGKCYVKCVTPDEYKTEEVRVEIAPAYKRLKVIPAKYETVTETVVVKEASKRYEYVPAEYETVYVDFEEEQPYNKLSLLPATFADDTKKIETYPAIGRWEYQAYEGCESDNPADCQVLCWREYPAQYTEVAIKTLQTDAGTTAAKAGGKQGRYAKQVIKKPAEMKEIPIPEETKTITRRVLVEDEKVEEEIVPAEYTTITKEVLVKKGGVTTWEEINCELLEYNVLPINYELGSARLTAQARRIIDERLLTLMQAKLNVRMEISAHTDSRGSNASNMDLSERRAQSVVSYLQSKGISASRLVAKGYGETRLKNRCADGVNCTEAEHAANRRTEFRILNQ